MTPSIPADFPDWLSPILVKEIRQGLRGKLFIAAFMMLHIMLLTWATLVAAAKPENATEADAIFWVILGVGLAVIVMSAQGAIRTEQTRNTLELLQLTRQSAWKIVCGKWCAIMTQVALFLTSLLPYGVLRYFFGTFEATRDLTVLFFLMLIFAGLASLMLLLSCFSRWLAIAANIGLALAFLSLLQGLVFMLIGFGRGSIIPSGSFSDHTIWLALGAIGYTSAYTLLLLHLAASRIASVSDNLATRKRLIGWLILAPAVIAAVVTDEKAWNVTGMLACAPLALVALDAVLVPTSPSVPAFAVFGRFGVSGRLAALLLGPSRAAGLLYTGVSLSVLCALFLLGGVSDISAGVMLQNLLALFGLILLPVALARILRKRCPQMAFTPCFWLCFTAQSLYVAAGALMGNLFNSTLYKLPACLSPVGVLFYGEDIGLMPALGCAIGVLSFSLLVLRRYLTEDLRAVWQMTRGERPAIPAI